PDARGEADLSRRVRGRVDREDVLVGEVEAHTWRPVASDRVEPLPALVVEADDDADIGRGDAIVALERRRHPGSAESVVDEQVGGAIARCRDRREDARPIAGEERCGVDARAIGAHRERARSVAEERQDLDRARGVVRIEDPYVGATDAWRGELGIARAVLASMSRRDEDEVSLDARDHDVARLIADER